MESMAAWNERQARMYSTQNNVAVIASADESNTVCMGKLLCTQWAIPRLNRISPRFKTCASIGGLRVAEEKVVEIKRAAL